MTARDETTLNFYAGEAAAYASRERPPSENLPGFLALLPAGARILELGCGGGHDSAAILAKGFDLDATDGSPELAREAELRLGRPVRVMLFDQLEAQDVYDGVWAEACLLHAPREELAGIIARIHAALRPGGVFYASYKSGDGEGRDRFDRYFNYPTAQWLRDTYATAEWKRVAIEESMGGGYDAQPTRWISVTAKKPLNPSISPPRAARNK